MTGVIARIRLRETPDFVDAKRRLQINFEKLKQDPQAIKNNPVAQEKASFKTSLALLILGFTLLIYIVLIF